MDEISREELLARKIENAWRWESRKSNGAFVESLAVEEQALLVSALRLAAQDEAEPVALADEIDAGLTAVLDAQLGGQARGNAEEALRRTLWDNKAGIIAGLRATPPTAAKDEARERVIEECEFPCRRTFEAIAAAVEIYPSKEQAMGFSISVRKFQEAFNNSRDKRPISALSPTDTTRQGGEG